MSTTSTPAYRFGDLLALARQSWIAQMAAGLAAAGYPDYRASDAAAIRLLRRGPMPVGRLGDGLGVTRQAARKVVAGLEGRGLAILSRDARDARQVTVTLTTGGQAYAQAIVTVIDQLNRALSRRVTRDQLAAADAVLRAALVDDHARVLAAYLPPPAPKSERSG
jgi:DNA-binding MarR family transcriptional regulator